MSERLGNRLRLGLLSFALIFTATAFLQYQFSAWQLRRVPTSELQSWGEELRDSVVGSGRWQLAAFRQSAPAAPEYFIVSREGLLVEVEGFVPGLLPQVLQPTWPTDDRPHPVRSPLDEEWLLLGHRIRGGLAVLGIETALGLPDAEERLKTNAARFGSDLTEAVQVTPKRIDPNIDYAVIDDKREVRLISGGLPLQTNPEDVTTILAAGPLVHFGHLPYYVHVQSLSDEAGHLLGSAVLFKDVSGEEAMRHQALVFNIAVGVISWGAVVALFLYYARAFRGPHISCEEAYASDEGQSIEFKSSLRWDYQKEEVNRELEAGVVKTVAAFLNADGGVLLIGIDDRKQVLGLHHDYTTLKEKPNKDGWELHLQQVLTNVFGSEFYARNVRVGFCKFGDKDVCIVTVSRSRKPVFVQESTRSGRADTLYVRVGNSTKALTTKEALAYAEGHWGG